MKIYIHKDGKQYGPYPVEQLRKYVQQGNFTTEDLACHDGQNWVTVAQVPGFAEATQPAASPSPTTPRRNQVVQKKAVKQQPAPANAVDSSSNKKKIILWSSIGGIAALLVTGLSIWLLGGDEARPESNGSAAPTDAKPVPAREIDLEDLGTRKKIALDKIIAEAIDDSRLEWRGKEGEELYYASPHSPHSGPAPIELSEEIKQKPYSGASKSMHENGQIATLTQYKDGKEHGLETYWYENGQKLEESTWKDGKKDGLVTCWHENGQKELEGNYKDDQLHGLLISYNEDGTEKARKTFKDGEPVEDQGRLPPPEIVVIVVEDFVGTYEVEASEWGPAKLVFLENGVGEYHNTVTLGSEVITIKWEIVKKGFVKWECKISGQPFSAVYRHNPDGSITGGMGTFKKTK